MLQRDERGPYGRSTPAAKAGKRPTGRIGSNAAPGRAAVEEGDLLTDLRKHDRGEILAVPFGFPLVRPKNLGFACRAVRGCEAGIPR